MALVKAQKLTRTDIHEYGFKLVGRDASDLICSNSLRRDHSIRPQLYFISSDRPRQNDGDLMGAYFSQLLADENGNDETVLRPFLDYVVRTKRKATSWWLGLDEVAKKLYVVDSSHIGGPIKITIYHLSFSSVEDRFGYREVNVVGDPKETTLHQTLASLHLQPTLIRFDQSNGHLLAVCSTGGSGRKSYVPSIIQFEDGGATLVAGKQSFGDKTIAKKKLSISAIERSRLGHLLVLFTTNSNKQTFLCSYTDKLELIQCVKIDQHDLLKRSLQATDDQCISSFLGNFRLLGHMHKYVLFLFERGQLLLIAIKWPKDWYTYKQLPPHPWRVRWLTVEPPEAESTTASMGFIGTDLYCVFQCADADGTHFIRKPSGGFKDYRSCANCGATETYKRKNKAGKRIADFKLCRQCKELNIHRLQVFQKSPSGCHYCSMECIRAHWNTHKGNHEQDKK